MALILFLLRLKTKISIGCQEFKEEILVLKLVLFPKTIVTFALGILGFPRTTSYPSTLMSVMMETTSKLVTLELVMER